MVQVLDDDKLTALFADKGDAVLGEDGDFLNGVIARWAAVHPARAAMREAQAAGWPVVVVNDPATLVSDDHLVARGFWVTAPADGRAPLPYCGAPWRINDGGWALTRTAPHLGQHTDDVLARVAGYSPEQITALRDNGVIA
jgi:crotonobetainyl-CoA:carnitine CoA-transferase CaiB-like acyl-CoA transferase